MKNKLFEYSDLVNNFLKKTINEQESEFFIRISLVEGNTLKQDAQQIINFMNKMQYKLQSSDIASSAAVLVFFKKQTSNNIISTKEDLYEKLKEFAKTSRTKFLSIPKFREIIGPALSKEQFDKFMLELSKERKIDLFYHDHPFGLSQQERDKLVYLHGAGISADRKGGTWYNGATLI